MKSKYSCTHDIRRTMFSVCIILKAVCQPRRLRSFGTTSWRNKSCAGQLICATRNHATLPPPFRVFQMVYSKRFVCRWSGAVHAVKSGSPPWLPTPYAQVGRHGEAHLQQHPGGDAPHLRACDGVCVCRRCACKVPFVLRAVYAKCPYI